MTPAKANWFTDAAVDLDGEPDPFAVPIEEIGDRIDLRDPQAALQLRVRELLDREGRLDAKGITCPIKDRSDSTCHACHVSAAHDRENPLGMLCRIGREQEIVLTELVVIACHVE